MNRIAVCGLGKLGSPIAVAFAASEVPVIGFDVDVCKVKKINACQAPVDEPELQAYLDLNEVRTNLKATNDIEEAVKQSDACMFVTPTPSLPTGAFDHTLLSIAIDNVVHEVARQRKRKYVFVINSTVMPRFLNDQVLPLLRRFLGSLGFGLAYKPEFIALGTVIRDLHYPDVLLIGQDTEETGMSVERLYRQMVLHDCQARRMKLVEAELAKISLNCAVTMKISFANQVGAVAACLGADPLKVLGAVGFDRRIGHAALRPGLPFGGPCFPRDNRMLQHVALSVGVRAPLSEATDTVNRKLLREILERIPLHGEVGILGLAYKPGTPITDEAAGSWWLQALRSRGRTVKAHDPQAAHPNELEEVLACQTIIIACGWPEYKRITVRPGTVVIDPAGETVVEYSEAAVATELKEA
jgi:UDPglucose 6-dehydrogenase